MSKTACIVPWTTLAIGPDGRATFCCDVPAPLTVNGRMGSLYQDSLEDLWNAGEVVEARAEMARGGRPESCRVCWEREAVGGLSRRLISNSVYRHLGGRLAVEALAREGAASGYRLERRPDWFILELGNVCNLKCRSCSPLFSSRIAADPVHAAWVADGHGEGSTNPGGGAGTVVAGGPAAAGNGAAGGNGAGVAGNGAAAAGNGAPAGNEAAGGNGAGALPPPAARPQRLRIVPENASPWFEDVDTLADMIASGTSDPGTAGGRGDPGAGAGPAAKSGAILSLMGGEPFLTDRTWRLLAALVDRGVAPSLIVGVVSNGQQRSPRLEELAPHFRRFNVSLSIDGTGKLYEVLRHGASWQVLVENLRWFQQVPNVDLTIVPTLQNGNALDLVNLLRFLDERGLPIAYNVLTWPARLSPRNLPASVRRIAAARLRHYLDIECRPANLRVVQSWCEVLEQPGEEFDAGLFAEFVTFTNDLDASRGESFAEAAPELVELVRAAGVEWPGSRRHVPAGAARSTFRPDELLRRVDRTIAAGDVIWPGFEAVEAGTYFTSAAEQLVEIDARLRQLGHPGLAGSRAVADFACHYGRMTRTLRAALPHAAVYACDIDREALRFCAGELGALPVEIGWRPDEERLPADLDAVICVSLLTHTPREHWRRALRAWARMLRPGGAAAFTYLAEQRLDAWLAGTMELYGSYSREQRAAAARCLREEGFGFAALTSGYGGEPCYGVAFASREVVRQEIAAAGLELLALPGEASPRFEQELALVRKPAARAAAEKGKPKTAAEATPAAGAEAGAKATSVAGAEATPAARAEATPAARAEAGAPSSPADAAPEAAPRAAPAARRDVSVVAVFDPRCYAPAAGAPGGHAGSVWAALTAARPPRPLPTELGFGDPRVAEVREEQAALAGEHGIDAFCYLYPWGAAAGPLWDAPWRDLLASGRPDFPFCAMVAIEAGEAIGPAPAGRLFDGLAAGLGDRRYLRLADRALVVVRDVTRLADPGGTARQWRAAAAARGLGDLHLCAAEPVPADRPEDLGFDSLLEAPPASADHAGVVAAALTRPWPPYPFWRSVQCLRGDAGSRAAELYEHWLRSAVEATRRHGEGVVLVDAWNDWLRGAYLEPDDRDGRAALLATRRAVRGPASGLVLLRRLRDELGRVGAPAACALDELEQVLALHEHTRDRLLASVEAALGRVEAAPGAGTLRWVPVASRHLPPSGGGFCLDLVGSVGGADLHAAGEPISLRGDEVHLAGWAHTAAGNGREGCAPSEVDLFLAFESCGGAADRVVRVGERVARLDVAAAFPGLDASCGFDTVVSLAGLPPGTYDVAIVQRTPQAAYRDATGVAVRREGG